LFVCTVNALKKSFRHLLDALCGDASLVGTDNVATREAWLAARLAEVPAGARILDAGAGKQQYKPFCRHLDWDAAGKV